MSNEQLELRVFHGYPLVRIIPGTKRPDREGWPEYEYVDEDFDDTCPIGVKLGGPTGFIDFDSDGKQESEAIWEQLTEGVAGCNTCGWSSENGNHRLFKVSPDQWDLIGFGRLYVGELEIRLGHKDGYSLQSVLPTEKGRKWFDDNREPAPLPHELALRLKDIRDEKEAATCSNIEHRELDLSQPGGRFTARTTWEELLLEDGWVYVGNAGGTDYWRRPGDTQQTQSASTGHNGSDNMTLWSSSVEGLEPGSINRFWYLICHRFGGDKTAAVKWICEQPEYSEFEVLGEDEGDSFDEAEEEVRFVDDERPITDDMLKVPGLIDLVSQFYCKHTLYPDERIGRVVGFMYVSWLLGGKVQLYDGTKPNLTVLLTAPSGGGKSSMQKTLAVLLKRLGVSPAIETAFASGAAMFDTLPETPNMIIMLDEVNDLLQAMSGARGSEYVKSIGTALKKMYDLSSETFYPRRKAGDTKAVGVDKPNVTTLLAGVHNDVMAALSDTMLRNGLFARMWLVDVDLPVEVNDNPHEDSILLQEILDQSRIWLEFEPEGEEVFIPSGEEQVSIAEKRLGTIGRTDDSKEFMVAKQRQWRVKARDTKDTSSGSSWARTGQLACKLELLYIGSTGTPQSVVTREISQWAAELAEVSTAWKMRLALDAQPRTEFIVLAERVLNKLQRLESRGQRVVKFSKLTNDMKIATLEAASAVGHLVATAKVATNMLSTSDGLRVKPVAGARVALYKHRKLFKEAKGNDLDVYNDKAT